MDRHPQDDLVIVMALGELSRTYEDVEPAVADRAWELAIEIAGQHGLKPSKTVRQLESDFSVGDEIRIGDSRSY